MIFHHTHQQVQNGSKTQTRRIQLPGDEAIYEDGQIIAVFRNGRRKWQVGHIYSVQPGRTERGVGYILITAIRQQWLQEINEADAKAEGVEPGVDTVPFYGEYKYSFYRLWQSIYYKQSGRGWNDNPAVWVLTFKKIGE